MDELLIARAHSFIGASPKMHGEGEAHAIIRQLVEDVEALKKAAQSAAHKMLEIGQPGVSPDRYDAVQDCLGIMHEAFAKWDGQATWTQETGFAHLWTLTASPIERWLLNSGHPMARSSIGFMKMGEYQEPCSCLWRFLSRVAKPDELLASTAERFGTNEREHTFLWQMPDMA